MRAARGNGFSSHHTFIFWSGNGKRAALGFCHHSLHRLPDSVCSIAQVRSSVRTSLPSHRDLDHGAKLWHDAYLVFQSPERQLLMKDTCYKEQSLLIETIALAVEAPWENCRCCAEGSDRHIKLCVFRKSGIDRLQNQRTPQRPMPCSEMALFLFPVPSSVLTREVKFTRARFNKTDNCAIVLTRYTDAFDSSL